MRFYSSLRSDEFRAILIISISIVIVRVPCGDKFLLGGMKKFFSPVGILWFTMLPTEVFGNLFRREFGFADIAEVSGKVNGFSCKKEYKI